MHSLALRKQSQDRTAQGGGRAEKGWPSPHLGRNGSLSEVSGRQEGRQLHPGGKGGKQGASCSTVAHHLSLFKKINGSYLDPSKDPSSLTGIDPMRPNWGVHQ